MPRVNPTGSPDSKICLIGEAPGAEEVLEGKPFVGSAGRLLNRLLKQAGISREQCYITNVVKYRPPDNNLKRLSEIGVSIEKSVIELKEELEKVNSNVFVPLGDIALQALTDKKSITKYRGSILPSTLVRGKKCVSTIHPAALFRDYKSSPLVLVDLQRVKKQAEFPEIILPKRTYLLNPTFPDIIANLERLNTAKRVTVDIETDMGASYVKCVGLTDRRDFAISIPIVSGLKPNWTQAEEKLIWELIREILTNPKIGKVAQNAPFEMEVLYPYVGLIYPLYMDTMIAHHLCYSELPKYLKTMTSIYTEEPFYKDDAKEANYESSALWLYNAKDTAVEHEISEVLDKELEEFGLTEFYHGYQSLMLYTMFNATRTGVKANKKKIEEYRAEAIEKMSKAENSFYEFLEKDYGIKERMNLRSPQQVKALLYGKLKFPVKFNKKTKRETTDEDAIESLAMKFPNTNIFAPLLAYTHQTTLLKNFLKDNYDKDGRIHSNFVITGTETGRLSSRKNIRGTGCNSQNQPKWLRDIYEADEGCSFIVGDLSQVEARIVGFLAKDAGLMQIFRSGGDIHSTVASWVYKIPFELVLGEQRQKIKHGVHAANYDVGEKTLANKIESTVDEARWLLNQYHNTFPGVRSWHKAVINQLSRNRTLINPFGRRRIFFGHWGDELFKEAFAHIPQSTTPDLLNLATLRAQFSFPEGAVTLLQVHDEIVVQCKDEDVIRISKLIKDEVERPLNIEGEDVVIPIELKSGKNWKDTKPISL